MYAYRRDKEDGPEGDLSLCHKVCFGKGILGILSEGLVEFTVLLLLYLFYTGEEGEREEREKNKRTTGEEGEREEREKNKRTIIMAALQNQLLTIQTKLYMHSTAVEKRNIGTELLVRRSFIQIEPGLSYFVIACLY